jgi:hypothetical protein
MSLRSSADAGGKAIRNFSAPADRVVLSMTPVPLDEVNKIYSSAHIGIVMYSLDYGPNNSEVAYASSSMPTRD